MNIEQAKLNLKNFLGGKELTFSIRSFDNGEWIAECNEISSIMTGGMGNDITNIDSMIRDAILTAAGIDTDYANEILKFTGYRSKNSILSNFLGNSKKEAEYALS